jgi:hypothetical protein
MTVEGRDDDDAREGCAVEIADNLEAAHSGHLQIEKNQVWLEGANEVERLPAGLCFANYLNVAEFLQFLPQDLSSNRLVVHHQGSERGGR